MPEIDTWSTDFPTCPHCGYVDQDYFEYNEDGNYTCGDCGKLFHVRVHHFSTFTTDAAKCTKCGKNLDIDHCYYCEACLTILAPDQVAFHKPEERTVIAKILEMAPPKDYDYKDGPLLFDGEDPEYQERIAREGK